MARAALTDFYQKFRFHVVEPNNFLNPAAGFHAAGIPEVSVDNADYRDGVTTYTKKQPGIPTIAEVTLSQGVVRRSSDFFNWLTICIEGSGDYRTDLEIWHFHRVDGPLSVNATPSRTIRLLEAYASSVKLADDLDSTGSDISLSEITIQSEKVEEQVHIGA